MPMGVAPSSLDVFLELTLAKYDKGDWINITQKYNDYEFVSRVFANNKVPEEGGKNLSWEVQVYNTQNARYSTTYDQDRSNVKNLMKTAYVPWSKQVTNYLFDIDEPALQGANMTEILDVIETKEEDMYQGWFDFMEEAMWTLPAVDATPQALYGIPYWVVQNATAGFNGGLPSGYSDVAALSSSTYTRWKNYTDSYTLTTGLTRDDAVEKLLQAMAKTKFKAPKPNTKADTGPPNFTMYCRYATWAALKRLQEDRNENLGNDIGWYDGDLVVRRCPLVWCSALDGGDEASGPGLDAGYPIYGINWRYMKFVFLRGRNQRRTGPEKVPGMSSVRMINVDNWAQFKCRNRRTQFVIYGA
jgi:hypothetical protein